MEEDEGQRTDTSPPHRCRMVPSSDSEGRVGVGEIWLVLHEKAVWGGEGAWNLGQRPPYPFPSWRLGVQSVTCTPINASKYTYFN